MLFPRRKREERACFLFVSLKLLVAFPSSLKHGDAGDFEDEERDGEWGDDGPPELCVDAHDYDPDTPPEAYFSKVIRVTCVAPKALIHNLPFVFGVLDESRKLPIANGLKEESNGPNGKSEIREPGRFYLLTKAHADGCGKRHKQDQDALEDKDAEQAVEPLRPLPAFAHVRVATIFVVLFKKSCGNVPGKTDTPETHGQRKQPLERTYILHGVVVIERVERYTSNPEAPGNVGYVIAPSDQCNNPPDEHVGRYKHTGTD